MKEYRPTEGDCVDIMWPKYRLMEAAGENREVRIKVPVGDADHYVEGKIGRFENSSFSIQSGDIQYAAVDWIEILPVESETESTEELTEGIWNARRAEDSEKYWVITERRNDDDIVIINRLIGYNAISLADNHNAALKKLNDRTGWQVLKDTGIPITMTKDGIEVGERCEPDYRAGIHKVGGMLSVYGFKMPMPDRVVIEYGDNPEMTGRRIIIDDDKIEIIDSAIEWKGMPDRVSVVGDIDDEEVMEDEN